MTTNDKTAPVSQQPDQNAERHIAGSDEPHENARNGRGLPRESGRNHCPGNDPGLLPVHAAQPRVGLPRAGSGDKTDKKRIVPLQGIPRGNRLYGQPRS